MSPPNRNRRVEAIAGDEDDEFYDNLPLSQRLAIRRRRHDDDEDEWEDDDEWGHEIEGSPLPTTIGEPVGVTGKGKKRKNHYKKFEYDGNEYELWDTVLLTPENPNVKPYVAVIKDITCDFHNDISITGQWFYRPEEAVKEDGGFWGAHDNRILFYSSHEDVFAAQTVMHTCVIHVIPVNKKFPIRIDHPGFIVQKFYNTVTKELSVLPKDPITDFLFQRTFERLGELPDVDDVPSSPIDSVTMKKNHKPSFVPKASPSPTHTSKQVKKDEKQGNSQADISLYLALLKKFKALTGVEYRDRWLGTLLQEIEATCASINDTVANDSNYDAGESVLWPNEAIKAVTSLERAAHGVFNGDYSKYNQKLRALRFNLKKSSTLAKRLLSKALDPVVIVNMSHDELKMGFTAEERTYEEPENSKPIQMTNVKCIRCSEKNVGISEIIHGGRWERYKLECCGCGNTWFQPREAVALL